MIIECEKCASKFNLDETLLKSNGSKVKCSMCKHVFVAYPKQQMSYEKQTEEKARDENLEETLPLDSANADFDLAFQRAGGETQTEESVSEEGTDAITEELEVGSDDDEMFAPRKKRSLPKILILGLLIILLIGIGGTMLYFSFSKSSDKQESIDLGVTRLKFRAVTGSFVESDIAGHLFVIKGLVLNEYPKPRSYIRLKGSIQDDKGKIVKTAEAFAGNSFSDKEIREMPLADLQTRQQNRSGDKEANVNIPSGGSIPFTIVFEKLPENISELSEFTVEAVSSSPGQ